MQYSMYVYIFDQKECRYEQNVKVWRATGSVSAVFGLLTLNMDVYMDILCLYMYMCRWLIWMYYIIRHRTSWWYAGQRGTSMLDQEPPSHCYATPLNVLIWKKVQICSAVLCIFNKTAAMTPGPCWLCFHMSVPKRWDIDTASVAANAVRVG